MADSSDRAKPLEPRETPCEIVLDYISEAEIEISGANQSQYPRYHVYVNCRELQNTNLPMDANPRDPSMTTQVKAMKKTLRGDSGDFVNRNNGIVILATSVEKYDGNLHIEMEEGEGVCNGGHTLLAINNFTYDEKSVAHLEIIEIGETDAKDSKEIAEIASARNNNNQLEERSEADFLGYYEPFKSAIFDSKFVEWREGDSKAHNEAISAYHFLRMLKSLDVIEYGHPLYGDRGSNHGTLATSVTRIHNRWKSKMDEWMKEERPSRPLKYLTPIVTDMMFIRDLVSHHLKYYEYSSGIRRTNLYQKYIKSNERDLIFDEFDNHDGHNITPPFEVLMIGLYRTNLYFSTDKVEEANLMGWFRHPELLWEQRSLEVIDQLQNDFYDADSDPKKFIRLNGPFNHDFYKHGMNEEISEEPDIIYDIETNDRFVKVSDENRATHGLKLNQVSKEDELQPNLRGSNVSLYREESLKKVYKYHFE